MKNRIICPKCDNLSDEIYYSESLGPKEDIICNKCKWEFTIKPQLSIKEQLFYEQVLLSGKEENLWDVDELILGGMRSTRRAFGVDFIIYGIKKGKRGVIWIEHKHAPTFHFTIPQLIRFTQIQDVPYKITRFCGITHTPYSEKEVNFIAYWTPNFFRALPKESFIKVAGDQSDQYIFSFRGLEKCFRERCFATYKPKFSEKEWIDLRTNPNLLLYTIKKGNFGMRGVEYQTIPLEEAFFILKEKLKYTVDHFDEDINSYYPNCKIEVSKRERLQPHIEDKASQILLLSYRPIFPLDLTNVLLIDESVRPELEWKSNLPYIEGQRLSIISDTTLRRLARNHAKRNIIQIKILKTNQLCYGQKGRKYFILSRRASHLLDYIRETYLWKLDKKIEHPNAMDMYEISEVTGVSSEVERATFHETKNELIENYNLITIEKIKKKNRWVTQISLTRNGINYIIMPIKCFNLEPRAL